jgi:hypothetical protein
MTKRKEVHIEEDRLNYYDEGVSLTEGYPGNLMAWMRLVNDLRSMLESAEHVIAKDGCSKPRMHIALHRKNQNGRRHCNHRRPEVKHG